MLKKSNIYILLEIYNFDIPMNPNKCLDKFYYPCYVTDQSINLRQNESLNIDNCQILSLINRINKN